MAAMFAQLDGTGVFATGDVGGPVEVVGVALGVSGSTVMGTSIGSCWGWR